MELASTSVPAAPAPKIQVRTVFELRLCRRDAETLLEWARRQPALKLEDYGNGAGDAFVSEIFSVTLAAHRHELECRCELTDEQIDALRELELTEPSKEHLWKSRYAAKLTEEQVAAIRTELEESVSISAIARKFGVSRTAIYQIRYGQR